MSTNSGGQGLVGSRHPLGLRLSIDSPSRPAVKRKERRSVKNQYMHRRAAAVWLAAGVLMLAACGSSELSIEPSESDHDWQLTSLEDADRIVSEAARRTLESDHLERGFLVIAGPAQQFARWASPGQNGSFVVVESTIRPRVDEIEEPDDPIVTVTVKSGDSIVEATTKGDSIGWWGPSVRGLSAVLADLAPTDQLANLAAGWLMSSVETVSSMAEDREFVIETHKRSTNASRQQLRVRMTVEGSTTSQVFEIAADGTLRLVSSETSGEAASTLALMLAPQIGASDQVRAVYSFKPLDVLPELKIPAVGDRADTAVPDVPEAFRL